MGRTVVVLNASFEPISRTRVSRAVHLVLSGDAVIHRGDPDRILRSEFLEIPVPKVIRRVRYINVSGMFSNALYSRRGVLTRDYRVCAYCSKKASTVDHVLPRGQGGSTDWLNVVSACLKCNHRKGNRTPEQAGMAMGFKPFVPTKQQLLERGFKASGFKVDVPEFEVVSKVIL